MTCVRFHVQGVCAVGGEDASVVCSHFGNKILICISHYQKFGTLVSSCSSTQFEQCSDLRLYPVCIQATHFLENAWTEGSEAAGLNDFLACTCVYEFLMHYSTKVHIHYIFYT